LNGGEGTVFGEFLTEEQIEALEMVIRAARSRSGMHRVPTRDGEAYAYQFNSDIFWHVEGPDRINMAKGVVPLVRATEGTVVPLERQSSARGAVSSSRSKPSSN